MPITNPHEIAFESLDELKTTLHTGGCKMCELGFQDDINGCCVSRGNPTSKKMIIGEAPGKTEDASRLPFTGPAGQLLDQIWAAAGMNIADWYLTNVCLCRPVAPKGSGRENLTPKIEQRKRCRPFLDAQISLLEPRIIVTLGKTALEAILGQSGLRMGDYRGRLLTHRALIIEEKKSTTVGRPYIFPMIHPAAILHAQGTDKYDEYRQYTWDDARRLKHFIEMELS